MDIFALKILVPSHQIRGLKVTGFVGWYTDNSYVNDLMLMSEFVIVIFSKVNISKRRFKQLGSQGINADEIKTTKEWWLLWCYSSLSLGLFTVSLKNTTLTLF